MVSINDDLLTLMAGQGLLYNIAKDEIVPFSLCAMLMGFPITHQQVLATHGVQCLWSHALRSSRPGSRTRPASYRALGNSIHVNAIGAVMAAVLWVLFPERTLRTDNQDASQDAVTCNGNAGKRGSNQDANQDAATCNGNGGNQDANHDAATHNGNAGNQDSNQDAARPTPKMGSMGSSSEQATPPSSSKKRRLLPLW